MIKTVLHVEISFRHKLVGAACRYGEEVSGLKPAAQLLSFCGKETVWVLTVVLCSYE